MFPQKPLAFTDEHQAEFQRLPAAVREVLPFMYGRADSMPARLERFVAAAGPRFFSVTRRPVVVGDFKDALPRGARVTTAEDARSILQVRVGARAVTLARGAPVAFVTMKPNLQGELYLGNGTIMNVVKVAYSHGEQGGVRLEGQFFRPGVMFRDYALHCTREMLGRAVAARPQSEDVERMLLTMHGTPREVAEMMEAFVRAVPPGFFTVAYRPFTRGDLPVSLPPDVRVKLYPDGTLHQVRRGSDAVTFGRGVPTAYYGEEDGRHFVGNGTETGFNMFDDNGPEPTSATWEQWVRWALDQVVPPSLMDRARRALRTLAGNLPR